MTTVFGVLLIAGVVLAGTVSVFLICDALSACIRAADALERIANALEDDEEMEVSDDEFIR
jgi:hypothetical protein